MDDDPKHFESCLQRLHTIIIQSTLILRVFEYNLANGPDSSPQPTLMHLNMVLQAHYFNEVRKDMRRYRLFAEIDRIVKPLVKMAISEERTITEARNDCATHWQKHPGYRETVEYVLAKYPAPADYAAWASLLMGIRAYALLVVANLECEAEEKYDMLPFPRSAESEIAMANQCREFCKELPPVRKALKRAGFRTTIDDDLF